MVNDVPLNWIVQDEDIFNKYKVLQTLILVSFKILSGRYLKNIAKPKIHSNELLFFDTVKTPQ